MESGLLEMALAAALHEVPGRATAEWLSRCAEWVGPLPPPADGDLDDLLDRAWRSRSRADRRRLGQVFTPRDVARQVLLEVGPVYGGILDPSCGGGIFLVEAAFSRSAALRLAGTAPEALARDVLANVHGVDIDPDAARLARLLLGLAVVSELGAAADALVATLPLPSVWCADATAPGALDRFGAIEAVVGNPPYLEAKGMDKPTRDRLRARFGARLDGAFDVYLCFLWLALDRVGPEGRIGFVLPNKLLVAKYAASFRQTVSEDGRLHALVDLSELDVFGRVGVYPVLLTLGPRQPTYKTCFAVRSDAVLGRQVLTGVAVGAALPLRLTRPPIWFTVPSGPLHALVDRLAGTAPPLRGQARARSTCSFHARGLRERYVGPSDTFPDGLPYLGGRSFTRRNEVQPFGVDWAGFRIRYAADALRAVGNPLPPLACFQRPKVVLCQHARSAIGWFDADGRFVTKDVYPILLPHDPSAEAAAAWTAVVNSRVFSTLYALMYRGIAIGSGYLHFLPGFLHAVPVPALSPSRVRALAEGVTALQAAPGREGYEALDDAVGDLYGLTAGERAAVHVFADERLGFGPDPLRRR